MFYCDRFLNRPAGERNKKGAGKKFNRVERKKCFWGINSKKKYVGGERGVNKMDLKGRDGGKD